jgi:hypothetical protein
MKIFKIPEATAAIEKANEIMDKKEPKNQLLFGRYRFLKSKIYKLRHDNKVALKSVDEALVIVKDNEDLRVDEDQMTDFRFQLIFSFTEEEIKETGINVEEEVNKERIYKIEREKKI